MKCGTGSIEVICGPMFSGKSEELMRRVRRALIGRKRVKVFKPYIDDRYGKDAVSSHLRNSIPAVSVEHSSDIAALAEADVVAIDEAQFLDEDLAELCNLLANRGVRVIVAGLDMDFLARSFPNMRELMARAEQVTKLSAICVRCGAEATRTYRRGDRGEQVVVGGAEMYEARCRRCHTLDQE